MRGVSLALAVGLVGLSALPAAASPPTNHPTGSNDPTGSDHPTSNSKHPTGQSCIPRMVAYRVHGTYVTSDLTKDPTTGIYSGTTVELIETSANHHARTATASGFTASKGADMTFTDTAGADVTVAVSVDTSGGPTAGPPADRVMVKGTITELHKNCSTVGLSQNVTINRVVVTPPEQTS